MRKYNIALTGLEKRIAQDILPKEDSTFTSTFLNFIIGIVKDRYTEISKTFDINKLISRDPKSILQFDGAIIEIKNLNDYNMPLFFAIIICEPIDNLRELINHRVIDLTNPHNIKYIQDSLGNTALHLAIYLKDLEKINLTISSSCTTIIDTKNSRSEHIAISVFDLMDDKKISCLAINNIIRDARNKKINNAHHHKSSAALSNIHHGIEEISINFNTAAIVHNHQFDPVVSRERK